MSANSVINPSKSTELNSSVASKSTELSLSVACDDEFSSDSSSSGGSAGSDGISLFSSGVFCGKKNSD